MKFLPTDTMEQIWEKATAWCENNYEASLLIGAFLALVLIWLLLRLLRQKPKQVKAFSDDLGTVYVTVHAITDLIRATCEHIPGISRPRIHLRQKNGMTRLELRLRLESGSRIREIREAIRDHLKRTLETNLGFDHLGDITVVIDEYKPGQADANVVATVPHQEAPPPEVAPEESEPVIDQDETVSPPPPDPDDPESEEDRRHDR